MRISTLNGAKTFSALFTFNNAMQILFKTKCQSCVFRVIQIEVFAFHVSVFFRVYDAFDELNHSRKKMG